jgi:HlyD family secretion protein
MTEPGRQSSGNAALWIGAALALVLVFFGVRRLTRDTVPIRVAPSRVEDLIDSTSTNGIVEPTVYFSAHAPVAGIVSQIYVRAGELAHRGQMLLRLDDADSRSKLAAAVAGVRAAEASLQALEAGGSRRQQLELTGNIDKAQIERGQAARDVAALKKLEAQGAASPSEVLQAEQRLQLDDASLASLEKQRNQPFTPLDLDHARAALKQAQASETAAALVVEQSNVRAPWDGTVYSLPVSRYEYVGPGTELLEMADLSKLRVRAYFDEPDIGNLKVGDPVTIVWAGRPGGKMHGRITRLPSTIMTYGTRNVGEVLVSIDDAGDSLLPNTNVTATVTTRSVENALTVPREALHIENGRDYVYTVERGALRRVPVEVGAINLTAVQILSGVSAGESVVLGATNGAPISEGMPVRIVE